MDRSGHTESRYDRGMIVIGCVLFAGIVTLGAGYFAGNRIAFYTGLLVTLAGVLTGVLRLVIKR